MLVGDQLTILDTEDFDKLSNPEIIIKAFIKNSCVRAKKASQKLLEGVTRGVDMKKTWDEMSGIDLV